MNKEETSLDNKSLSLPTYASFPLHAVLTYKSLRDLRACNKLKTQTRQIQSAHTHAHLHNTHI